MIKLVGDLFQSFIFVLNFLLNKIIEYIHRGTTFDFFLNLKIYQSFKISLKRLI